MQGLWILFIYPLHHGKTKGFDTKVMSYAVFCSILLGEVELAGHAYLLLTFLHIHNYIFSSSFGLHSDFASSSFTTIVIFFDGRLPRCLVLY